MSNKVGGWLMARFGNFLMGTATSASRSLSPLTNLETEKLFSRVVDTIYATIFGTLAKAVAQGALGGLMLW